MKKEYEQTYKASYNFLKWCQYWTELNFGIKHTSWKKQSLYPLFIKVERNDEKYWKQPIDKYVRSNYEYYAIDEKGKPAFFDRSYHKKGEWTVIKIKDDSDLFE